MKTIKEIIQLSTDYLAKAGIESPRVDAEWLIADALNMRRMDIYLQFDRPLEEVDLSLIRERIKRRSQLEPVQYIIGDDEFYGLNFKVGPGVLVPRSETELLVDKALKLLKAGDQVLDLCTGSGCIAASLKKTESELNVYASDMSPDALSYARQNIAGLECEVEIREGDLFAPFSGMKFNAICTNPPYVAENEVAQMGKDVVKHEPHMALFSGMDGADILRKISQQGKSFLEDGGFLISEMGPEQGALLESVFSADGWKDIEILKDYSGRERFLLAYKN
ncbi:MAG: peptide chain release factor N(5)-glutamine methyltransferase [Lentisphaerales bacterium]|nr:peptide chain release factor N(5)-glutamine methyltransferase [Lentisphaerales bacterium]